MTLLEQLRQFPLGAHDDGPDALQMAVSVTQCGPPSLTGISLSGDDDRGYDPLLDDELWDECG